jgi:hypothetical protein
LVAVSRRTTMLYLVATLIARESTAPRTSALRQKEC